MQLSVGKKLMRRVMFKRSLSVGLSDKHNDEKDFLYSNPEKWNWRLMNKQCILFWRTLLVSEFLFVGV